MLDPICNIYEGKIPEIALSVGTFGKLTGEFGTIEQANEDDAVVKWDGDGLAASFPDLRA
jgi:hypothetical protein